MIEKYLKYSILLEQIFSTSANLLITILMVRQLDLNYLGHAQTCAIPAITLNSYVTTKFYLPIASLLDKLDKLKAFLICLKIEIFAFALMFISFILFRNTIEGIGLGFLMGLYIILTDFCRYFLITLRQTILALLVSFARLVVVAFSIILAHPLQQGNNVKLWLILLAIGLLPSLFGVLASSQQLMPYKNSLRLFGSLSFQKGGSSNIFSLSNSISGFLKSASLAYCGAGAFAAYNAFLKISNILNPILQLIELKPRSRLIKIFQSIPLQLSLFLIGFFALTLTYKQIANAIFGDSSSGFEGLFIIVFVQVIFSAFSRIMSSKCRVEFDNSIYIFRTNGILAIIFSVVTLIVALLTLNIYISSTVIASFYILQYLVLIKATPIKLFSRGILE